MSASNSLPYRKGAGKAVYDILVGDNPHVFALVLMHTISPIYDLLMLYFFLLVFTKPYPARAAYEVSNLPKVSF